jgi:hypothetical protein
MSAESFKAIREKPVLLQRSLGFDRPFFHSRAVSAADPPLVLQHVAVVDVSVGALQPDRAVVIQGDRIHRTLSFCGSRPAS